LRRGAGAQAWWVQQQGVVANDTASGPGRLDHQVDKWVGDCAVTGDTNDITAVATALQGQLQAGNGGVVFKAGSTEGIRRGHGNPQAGGFFRIDFGNVDFGPQRLTQGRLNRKAAQCQRLRFGTEKAEHRRRHDRQDGRLPVR
jgi:hypothetical protein